MTNDKAADLFKQLAKEQGFTDEQVAKAMAAPQWKEIENRDNRHSEYSSALDKAKNFEAAAKKAGEWDDWWKNKGGGTVYQKYQEQQASLARYQERFGALDPNDPNAVRQGAEASGMTMQQVQAMLEARLNEQGTRFSAMTADLGLVMTDAANRGIKLSPDDIQAMNKIMADKGVTYGAAYAEHLGPKVREMESQKLTKEKEDYAAEKVRDALSRVGHNGLPPVNSEVPSFFERPKAGIAEKSLSDQELLGMWNDAAPKRAA